MATVLVETDAVVDGEGDVCVNFGIPLGDPAAVSFVSSSSIQCALEIGCDVLRIESIKSPPCWWWRFWQWALLGWRWIDLRE